MEATEAVETASALWEHGPAFLATLVIAGAWWIRERQSAIDRREAAAERAAAAAERKDMLDLLEKVREHEERVLDAIRQEIRNNG